MESLVFMLWCVMAGIFPISFLVLSYIRFGRETALIAILARLTPSFFVYFIASFLILQPMFVMLFAGAHAEPVGNSLTDAGKSLITSLVVVYGIVNYLLASFVRGRLIGLPYKYHL
jgi:hypothetical protein